MHDLKTITSKYKSKILLIANESGVESIRIFGSVARGDQSDQSDIDFLVKAGEFTTYLTLSKLKRDLEELLKCQVDIITESGVSERLRPIIESEAKPL